MEETRRDALARRSALLARTRQEVEASLTEATSRLRAQAAEAKSRLDRDAAAMADQVVERVLGRKIS
jgi:F0F1-type ATP synthase membrane subunit b/b'